MLTQENTPEGRNLRAILDEGPLPVARAIQIAREIARGLADAHLKGVVHGSLKPSNILVSPSGAVRITGFGSGQIDHRCDIFALGTLFYEMLTHRAPILDGDPPPPSELNQHVPRALDAIVLSMLARQPADRMPGAPILLRELQRLEEGLGLASGADAAADEPAASVPTDRREPGLRTPDEASEHYKQLIDRDAFDHHRAMMQRESERQRSSASRLETFVAVGVVVAVLGIGIAGFLYFTSSPSERSVAASRKQPAPVAAPETPRPSAPPPVAEASKEPVAAVGAWQKSPPPAAESRPNPPAPVAEAPKPVAEAPKERAIAPAAPPPSPARAVVRPVAPPPVAEAPKERAAAPAAPASPPPAVDDGQARQESPGTLFGLKVPPKTVAAEPGPLPQAENSIARAPPEQPAPARAAPAKELPRAAQPAAKAAERQPRGKAQLILAVSPGGEIYIDDKYLGDIPPMTTFDLDPGMYRIEVRSGSRKPFLTYMTVEAGDVRRIRHDFDAKPSRPPG